MAKRLSRIERDIERLKEKISEYQQQLKELEAEKTEQENLQIISDKFIIKLRGPVMVR